MSASAVAQAYLLLKVGTDMFKQQLGMAKSMAVDAVGAIAGIMSGGAMAAGGALFGAGAAGGFLKDIVGQAADAEQSIARFNIVLKNMGPITGQTAGTMSKLSEEIQATSVFSAGAIRHAQTLMGTFEAIRGDTFKTALKEAADLASLMGTDLPEAASLLGHALEHPERAMRMLRRAHVQLNEEEVKGIKNATGVGQKQAIILNAVARSTKGASEAIRNTFGGQIQVISNQWERFKTMGGAALLPALKMVTPIIERVVTGLQKLGPIFDEISEFGSKTFGEISGAIGHTVDTIENWISENKQTFATWGGWIKRIVTSVWESGKAAFTRFADFLSEGWTQLSSDTGLTWDNIKSVVTNALEAATFYVENFGLACKMAWAGMKWAALDTWDSIKRGVISVINIIAGEFARLDGMITAAKEGKGFDDIIKAGVANRDKFMKVLGDMNGPDAAVKDAKKEFEGLVLEFARKAKEHHDKGVEPLKLDKKNKVEDDLKAKAEEPIHVKFDFVGFSDQWKNVQKQMSGGDMTALTKRIADNGDKAVKGQDDANKVLKDIKDGLDKIKPGFA